MNTKGIKFLAVLAVMAMAFAAFAVFASSANDDAITVNGDSGVYEVPATITDRSEQSVFYVAEDTTVKIKGQKGDLTFYVQNGKNLELDFKAGDYDDAGTVSIISVTGDQDFVQDEVTVNAEVVANTTFNGKYICPDTTVTFAGYSGLSVYYKAAQPKYTVGYENNYFVYSYTAATPAQISADDVLDANDLAIGSQVAIASGQTIVVSSGDSALSNTQNEAIAVSYGIRYATVDSGEYLYTYYASGNNAGEIGFSADDEVIIKSGSAAMTTSGATIKAASVSGAYNNPVIITAESSVSGSFAVTGGVYSGSMTLGGKVNPDGLTVEQSGTVTIANKAEIVSSATVTVDGELVVKTAGSTSNPMSNLTVVSPVVDEVPSTTGVLVLQNGKLWTADASGITITTSGDAGAFAGLIETSAISTTYYGEVGIATATIAKDQTYTMDGNTNIKRAVIVEGIMVVNEGVTLTLDNAASVTMVGQYSQIINNGKIIVKADNEAGKGLFADAGRFINNGTLELSAKAGTTSGRGNTATFTTNGINFINNGTVNVSKNDNICLNNFTNNGTLNISGKFVATDAADSSTVFNYGRMVYNGAEIGTSTTSVLGSNNATVFISSVKMSSAATFEVNNSKMTNKSGSPATSSIVLSGADKSSSETLDEFTVRGATFTGVNNGKSNVAIDMQGAMGLAIASDSYGTVSYTVEGATTVKNTLSIPKDMTIAFLKTGSKKAPLTVDGTMIINKDALGSTGGNLKMTVNGKVIDNKGALNNCEYIAAKYITTNATIYTTLENAISEAVEAEVMSIDIGAITITKDMTIPAGMSINGDYGVTIGTADYSPTVTINSTGRLSATPITLVNGVIEVEDSADISDEAVFAHVKVENGDSVTYQSLNVALALAKSGDYIPLNSNYVLIDSSVVIPAGVTVDATADDEGTIVAIIGSNLDIDGTFIVGDFYFIAETDETVETTVGGFLKDEGVTQIKDKWFTPIGVSYYETTLDPRGDEVTYFVITNLDNLQQAVDTADDKKVTVEGKAKLGDVTIKGTEDEPAEVTFKDDISAGTITLENATIIAQPGNQINATFADEYGAIIVKGAYVGAEKDVNIYSLGEQGVFIRGPLTDGTNGTYSILFMGKTGMNNATIGWGNYQNDEEDFIAYPTITFAGDTLATGKNVISADETDEYEPTSYDAGIVTIAGALTADNGSKITIIADVDVLGTLAAKERTTSSTNGTIEAEGNIFLGITKAEVYSSKALCDYYIATEEHNYSPTYYGHAHDPVAATATLAGKIDVNEAMYITAAPGSNIDDSIIEDMGSIDIFIEDKLWLTVYGIGEYNMEGLTPPIENCEVDAIYDAEGNPVAKYSKVYGVIYDSEDLSFGVYDAIFMSLDYNIYTVLIKTDASIKAVYIDGILTYTGFEQNQFFLYRVAAGTHTVTVEPATGYTAENAYLYTEMGTLLKGLKFTFDESDCIYNVEGDYYEVIYNVAGTEKITEVIPEPEQVSEWTITTILLLVLVVLIAIMAVIVALRLNRS